jgi:hypothetical protein
MPSDLVRLVDESAIKRLLYTYCRGVDRRDLALVRSCCTADAFDGRSVYEGGIDDMRRPSSPRQ